MRSVVCLRRTQARTPKPFECSCRNWAEVATGDSGGETVEDPGVRRGAGGGFAVSRPTSCFSPRCDCTRGLLMRGAEKTRGGRARILIFSFLTENIELHRQAGPQGMVCAYEWRVYAACSFFFFFI